jgi:DNA-binding NarL/FixJ family response regulator
MELLVMSELNHTAVLIIGTARSSAVADHAADWLWCLAKSPKVGSVLREVRTHTPQVVVVELDDEPDLGVAVLTALRRFGKVFPCVMVGRPGRPDLELAARRAGAACYVPTWRGIDRVVAALLAGSGDQAMPAKTNGSSVRR